MRSDAETLPGGAALSSFLDGAARLCGVDRDVTLRLGWVMLAAGSGPRSQSALNYDSSPVQMAITSSDEGLGYRLLVDPAANEPDPERRYLLSREALRALAAARGHQDLARLFEATLESQIGNSAREHPDGVLWLATALGEQRGLALYVDARRGGAERAFGRLSRWFLDTAGDTDALRAFLVALRGHARLMCLGLEGTSPERTRAKVYWRLDRARRLDSLGIPGLDDERLLGFLDRVAGDRQIRLDGVVLNAGFHVGSGRPTDLKIDLCCCRNCLAWARGEAIQRIAALAAWLGVATPPVAAGLAFGELANIGVGVDHHGVARMNVYLKPLPTGAPEAND